MVKKMTSVLFALIFLCSISLNGAALNKKETAFAKSVVSESYSFMRSKGGFGLNQYDMLVYAMSSCRVAKMFPTYPSTSAEDRVKKFMSWGAQESVWQPNFVAINIPGAKYSNGRVKFFSVDYDWPGINSENTEWAYQIASSVQQKRKLPRGLHPRFVKALKDVRIPSNIKLKHIDPRLAAEAKKEWLRLVRSGVNVNRIASKIKVPYESTTEDDVDSMLIYRVLIEMDRHVRGWKEGSQRRDLYEHLDNLYLGLE